MTPIQEALFALQDPAYRAFQCKLMPTVDPARVIGVRTPALRRLARDLQETPEAAAFLQSLPHAYYEEDNLHGLLLSALRDYGAVVDALEAFLPHVDNWATCDLLSPRAFHTRPPQLPGRVRAWLDAGDTYTVRFGLGVLMREYLEADFQPDYLDWAAGVRSGAYYVNMMLAWYFATALAKQWAAALPYLEQRRLDRWVHNKTIQKAVESCRITPEQKVFLKTLRWND